MKELSLTLPKSVIGGAFARCGGSEGAIRPRVGAPKGFVVDFGRVSGRDGVESAVVADLGSKGFATAFPG